MYTLNRAPGIAIPGLDQIQPIRHDYSGIERGLGAFGEGLAGYLEEKQLRDALEEANNPKIERLQRERKATQDELQRAQAETDQVLKSEAYDFVYHTPNPTPDMITTEREAEVQSYLDFAKNQAPEQKRRGLEPAAYVDAQAPVQEPYYKVGSMEFSAPPDPQALEVITNQNKAKAVEAQDPRLAMAYEQKAQQALADKLRQTYLQLERAEDVPGAVRLHNDIPDGLTSVERQAADGTWEVYQYPDGKPDEARLFARGTSKDVFSAIRRSVDPDAFDRAAELQYTRQRQEGMDQRAAQQEARYADNARRQELAGQLQYLQQRANSATNQADFVRFSVLAEQTAAELYGMGQGGAGGPTAGSSPAWLVNNESGGNWGAQNDAMGAGGTPGHYGRLQFGVARLREAQQALGKWFTPDEFMANPQLQQAVEAWHQNDINQYIQEQGWDTSGSTRVLGVPMTPGAMFAVAHLGGKDGLRRFMETNGAYNPADRNGTRLSNYAEKGYRGDLQQSPVAAQQPVPQQGRGGPATPPGAGASTARAPLTQVAQASVGALGTDFNAEWQARQGGRGAGVDKTVRDAAIKSYFKTLEGIYQEGGATGAQDAKIDAITARYMPFIGGGAAGGAEGLSPALATMFGLPAGPTAGQGDGAAGQPAGATAGQGGGAAGQPAASTGQPAPAAGGSAPKAGLLDSLTAQREAARTAGQRAATLRQEAATQQAAFQAAVAQAQAAIAGDVSKTAGALQQMDAIYPFLPPAQQQQLERLARILLAQQPPGAAVPAPAASGANIPFPW